MADVTSLSSILYYINSEIDLKNLYNKSNT